MYSFTTEDLLQYLYNETSADKSAAIKSALNTDWTLRERLEKLSTSRNQLNKIPLMAPNKRTLNNIFNYAEKAVEELSEKA
jgi:hypothetical protein